MSLPAVPVTVTAAARASTMVVSMVLPPVAGERLCQETARRPSAISEIAGETCSPEMAIGKSGPALPCASTTRTQMSEAPA